MSGGLHLALALLLAATVTDPAPGGGAVAPTDIDRSMEGVGGSWGFPAQIHPAAPSAWTRPDPEYYAFELVPTRSVTGTGAARGEVRINFGTSPFGVSVGPDGSYRYDVRVEVQDLPRPPEGEFVAWVARNDLEEILRIGPLDRDGVATGTVDWNKFIVVVTLEAAHAEDAGRWSGPVVLRGLSRSGLMHPKAGHGPFQEALCLALGYGACRSVGR